MDTGAKIRRNFIIPSSDNKSIPIDIIYPSSKEKCRTCVIFIHGGGFIGGDKDQFLGAATYLALFMAVVCVSVQYRTDTPYPRPVEDVVDVINYIYKNSDELGINKESICLIGGSPGANISLLTMSKEWRCKKKLKGFIPRFGIFLNGIYDLELFNEINESERLSLKKYFGKSDYRFLLKEASPINYSYEGSFMAFFHGTSDQVVPLSSVIEMKKQVEAMNGKVLIYKFLDKPHAWFNKDINQYDVFSKIKIVLEKFEEEINKCR